MRRRFDLWHPSTSRLSQWLDSGEPHGVGVHVEQCDRCADRLEELDLRDATADAESPGALRQALMNLLSPPDDLRDRVLHGVEVRSRADRELQLIAGLFSIGIETAQLMLSAASDQDRTGGEAPSGDDDRDQEDRP